MIDRMTEIGLGDGLIALEAARLLMSHAFGIPGQEEEEEEEED